MDDSAGSVWLVDDNDNDAEEAERFLEGSHRLEVECIRPLPNLQDYASLLGEHDTSAVIVDHHLTEASVPYDGMGIASYLRSMRPELPIFVLTNCQEEELAEHADLVEDIIEKGLMREHPEVYVSRILRSMRRYESALDERQVRLRELIDRSISGEITMVESEELSIIRNELERPFDEALAEMDTKRERDLLREEAMIDRLERLFERVQPKVVE